MMKLKECSLKKKKKKEEEEKKKSAALLENRSPSGLSSLPVFTAHVEKLMWTM